MPRLDDLAISAYLNGAPTRHGRIKVECADFVVHEIYNNEVCTEKPKLDIGPIIDAHNLLLKLSSNENFSVLDDRVLTNITSVEDVLELYNVFKNTQKHDAASKAGSEDICVGTYSCAGKGERTEIHAMMKGHPFVNTKTNGSAIHFVFSTVNTYTFIVKKINRDTASVASFLKRKLGQVFFAGNKDKRAVTYQRMSAKTDFLDLYGCDVFDIKMGDSIKLGELGGNMFVVRVRGCKLVGINELKFLNYYGNQRFGIGFNNHEVGRCVVEKRDNDALELIIKTYSDNYERSKQDTQDTEQVSRDATTLETEATDGVETVYELYIKEKYEEAFNRVHPRFGTERHILVCKLKGLEPHRIFRTMRRESLMLYLHAYQSYLFNRSVNERLTKERQKSCFNVASTDYVLENGSFVQRENADIDDVWLKLPKLDHPMCKGGYRKMIETASDLEVEICEDDTILKFRLKPCSFATMAIRELIGEDILSK